jgi:Uma2 family endonuclease
MARNLTQLDEYIPPELIALTQRTVTPEEFEQLCAEYDDWRLELTSTGELIVMPPADLETGRRSAHLTYQLEAWSRQDRTGVGFASCAGFTLSNGAIRSPDTSWMRREKWDSLSKSLQEGFAPVCPDFVVELRSASDHLPFLLNKMLEYMANGASLGLLIDPAKRQVYIYRPNEEVVVLDPETVSRDPLLPGFTLDLTQLW